MALSYIDYVMTAANTGPFSFAGIDGFLSVEHIHVYKNEVELTSAQFTITSSPPEVTLASAGAIGDRIRIRRITPATTSELSTQFQDGTILRASDLRDQQLQGLYISQEKTELPDAAGELIRIRTSKTPASATALGNAGEICWDSGYLYVCIATNTWRRAALGAW